MEKDSASKQKLTPKTFKLEIPATDKQWVVRANWRGNHDFALVRHWSEEQGKWIADYMKATAYTLQEGLAKIQEKKVEMQDCALDLSGFAVGSWGHLNTPTCDACGQLCYNEDERGMPILTTWDVRLI